MTAGTPDGRSTLRAERIEVVDADGRVRFVVGASDRAGEETVFGARLLNEDGNERAWLSLTPNGPELAFSLGGNVVLQVGVEDPTPETTHVGAHLHLSDEQGRLAIAWSVEADGSVTMETGGRER